MTSQNARLQSAQTTNDQIKVIAMKMALETWRGDSERWEDAMKRARDMYDFMRVSAPTSLQVVSANDMPSGGDAA